MKKKLLANFTCSSELVGVGVLPADVSCAFILIVGTLLEKKT